MKLAILEAGRPPGGLEERFGRYPEMFARLLGDGLSIRSYEVAAGELPAAPEDQEAVLITGAEAGVHDALPWLGALEAFLRRARGRTRLIGICFGHQMMAKAYGGRVAKAEAGWGVGLHSYRIARREAWMDDSDAIASPASHQDQVVAPPPGTDVLAASAFTPFAGLAWRDQLAVSFQFHPEFSPDYAKAMIEIRRGNLEQPEAALASLDAPNDNARVGAWIRRFLGA